jgi:hypothetical protein
MAIPEGVLFPKSTQLTLNSKTSPVNVKVKVKHVTTDGQSIYVSGIRDQICITIRQLRVC